MYVLYKDKIKHIGRKANKKPMFEELHKKHHQH